MSKETNSHGHHVLPMNTYLGVAAALLVLTGITVWVAQFHFGEWNLVVAMIVAATKAILVALIFMHLLYDNKLYLVVFAGSVLFLAVFIIITMFDTLRRDDIYEFLEKPINPKAAIYHVDTTKTAGADSLKATVPADSPAH